MPRNVVADEVDLRATGAGYMHVQEGEPERTIVYRNTLNADGSPSEMATAGYRWAPGTELSAIADLIVGEGVAP